MMLKWDHLGASPCSFFLLDKTTLVVCPTSPVLTPKNWGFFLRYCIFSYNIVDVPVDRRDKMDTTRWKSVLVPREVYEEIKKLSKSEGRTIGGQLRLVFDWYKDAQTADHEAIIDDNAESR